jgi:hypothetical protein
LGGSPPDYPVRLNDDDEKNGGKKLGTSVSAAKEIIIAWDLISFIISC